HRDLHWLAVDGHRQQDRRGRHGPTFARPRTPAQARPRPHTVRKLAATAPLQPFWAPFKTLAALAALAAGARVAQSARVTLRAPMKASPSWRPTVGLALAPLVLL